MKLLFEKSVPGSNGFTLPEEAFPKAPLPEALTRATPAKLPELSEVEAVRHYMALSHRAYGVDDGSYPLGSCTMKYNPKINEWAARLPGFASLHPMQDAESVQGILELLDETAQMLSTVCGMDAFTLQPSAGAQGEMVGIQMIKAYHDLRGDTARTKMLVPDSAHGTNPATAHGVGYQVVEVKSDARGLVDLEDLAAKMDETVAGLMLTNPNTLGLFERDIQQMAELVHARGGLLYYDGANLNAIMGVSRPGDMGFDVVHLNLHKTFSTPHGGGGPGSGCVGVKALLAPFLPGPLPCKTENGYGWTTPEHSIGRVHGFHGNVGIVIRAYTYLKTLGGQGIRSACEMAVLAANYLRVRLQDAYEIPYNTLCKHEFVMSASRQAQVGATAICKRLLDFGIHPPTVHFPLIVKESLMIEPTETECLERLDALTDALLRIAEECAETPDVVLSAPHTTPISRVDEVRAARSPVVTHPE